MPVEVVTTDGIFALDGGEWEVTNNIWIVGDDREVVVFDAAHDHRPIVEAVNGRRVVGIVMEQPILANTIPKPLKNVPTRLLLIPMKKVTVKSVL